MRIRAMELTHRATARTGRCICRRSPAASQEATLSSGARINRVTWVVLTFNQPATALIGRPTNEGKAPARKPLTARRKNRKPAIVAVVAANLWVTGSAERNVWPRKSMIADASRLTAASLLTPPVE
jgi:hypothetical protein